MARNTKFDEFEAEQRFVLTDGNNNRWAVSVDQLGNLTVDSL